MLLALLVTAGAAGLLVAMGWIADRLLRDEAERWARRVDDQDRDRV